MLRADSRTYPRMTSEELERFQQAVAEEKAGEAENRQAALQIVPHLLLHCDQAVSIVEMLRAARDAANVSLGELELRTGIRKSVLSRLENSKAPNPTLATLQRYAAAIGLQLDVSLRLGDADK